MHTYTVGTYMNVLCVYRFFFVRTTGPFPMQAGGGHEQGRIMQALLHPLTSSLFKPKTQTTSSFRQQVPEYQV